MNVTVLHERGSCVAVRQLALDNLRGKNCLLANSPAICSVTTTESTETR